jgi:hypothetical protein
MRVATCLRADGVLGSACKFDPPGYNTGPLRLGLSPVINSFIQLPS